MCLCNLKVAELDRNNICMFNVVYTYHNHAVEPSNTVAIAISPFNGASAWQCVISVVQTQRMRQSQYGMHLTTLIYTFVNFLGISLILFPHTTAIPAGIS